MKKSSSWFSLIRPYCFEIYSGSFLLPLQLANAEARFPAMSSTFYFSSDRPTLTIQNVSRQNANMTQIVDVYHLYETKIKR